MMKPGIFQQAGDGCLVQALFPSIIFLIMFFFVPESPRWLASKERWDDANYILTKVNGKQKAQQELAEIKEALNIEKNFFLRYFKTGYTKSITDRYNLMHFLAGYRH